MLGQLKQEHHGREMEGMCKGVGGGGGGQNTVRKKIQMCPIDMTVSHAQTLPLQQVGEGREGEGCGASSSPLPKPGTDDARLLPPPFSPLHSVSSSRCQEVAQCLFLFIFFILKGCMISHVFFYMFVLQSWRSRLVVKEFQVGLCVCVSSCPQSLDSLVRSSGSSWSVVTKTTRIQGTVYGRIRDTLHYRVHP